MIAVGTTVGDVVRVIRSDERGEVVAADHAPTRRYLVDLFDGERGREEWLTAGELDDECRHGLPLTDGCGYCEPGR